MFRRIEVGLGIFAGALGLIGLGFAVFGPSTYSYGTNWLTAATVSLAANGIGTTSVVVFLAVMTAASLAVALGTYLHSRGNVASGLTLVWTGTLALAVGATMTLPGSTAAVVPSALHTDIADSVGIGIYLIPAAFASLAAAFTSTVGADQTQTPQRPVTLTPH